jgi:hypothetical protein
MKAELLVPGGQTFHGKPVTRRQPSIHRRQCVQCLVQFQPAQLGGVDRFAEFAGAAVHFFVFLAVDRGVEVGIGELGVQRSLFFLPFGQVAVDLLDFLGQLAPFGE